MSSGGKCPFNKNIRRSVRSIVNCCRDKPYCSTNWWKRGFGCANPAERLMFSMGWLMWIGASPRATGPGTIIEGLNKIVWNGFCKGGGIYALGICGGLAWPGLNCNGLNGAGWCGGDTDAGCFTGGCALFNRSWMVVRKRSIRWINSVWVSIWAVARRLLIVVISRSFSGWWFAVWRRSSNRWIIGYGKLWCRNTPCSATWGPFSPSHWTCLTGRFSRSSRSCSFTSRSRSVWFSVTGGTSKK